MNRKIYMSFLMIAVVVLLAACGKSEGSKGNIETPSVAVSATPTSVPVKATDTPAPTLNPTETPTPTEAHTPTPTPLPAKKYSNDNSAAHNRECVYSEQNDLKELYERASEIGNRFGIYIYIGDLIPDGAEYWNYEPMCDPERIGAALDVIEKVFSAYPEGFFDQLVYNEVVRTEMALVGFCADGMGFASTEIRNDGEANMIVIDLSNDGLVDTVNYILPHELTHVIDYKIRDYEEWDDEILTNFDEEWAKLNPKGFEYALGDEDKELDLCDQYYEYFAFSYGCANPLEDRATLMGLLLQNDLCEVKGVRLTIETYEKLEFYFQCLRKAFDTTGWPEMTSWETELIKERPFERDWR